MKIALPSKNKMIDDHFGHCEYFTVFTIGENKQIIDEERIDSPNGCGCKSNIAQELANKGVKLMIAGNMGEGALRVLNNSGIQVLRGCSGDIREAAIKYLNGEIVDSQISCSEHGHECHH